MNEHFGILVTKLNSYDELVDRVRGELINLYGSIDKALKGEGFDDEDEMIQERIRDRLLFYFEEIKNPVQLMQYWFRNGWVSRGEVMWYIAKTTDWDLIFNYLAMGEVDEMLGAVVVRLTELNDFVRHHNYTSHF